MITFSQICLDQIERKKGIGTGSIGLTRKKFAANNKHSQIEFKLTKDSAVSYRNPYCKDSVFGEKQRDRTAPKVLMTDEDVMHNIQHLQTQRDTSKLDYARINKNRTLGRYEPKPIDMNIVASVEEDEQPRRSTRVLDIKLVPANGDRQSIRKQEMENETERRPSVRAHPIPVLEMKQREAPASGSELAEHAVNKKRDTPISASQSETTQNTTCNDVEFIQLKPAKLRPPVHTRHRDSNLPLTPVDKPAPAVDREKPLKPSTQLRPSTVTSKLKYIEFKPVRETITRKKSELLIKKDTKTCLEVQKQTSATNQEVPIKTKTPPRPVVEERSVENHRQRSKSKSAAKETVFRLVLARKPATMGHPALFATQHSSNYRKHFSPPTKRQLSP